MYILDFECFEDEDIIFGIEDYFQVLVYRVKTDFGLKKKYSRRGELYFSPRQVIRATARNIIRRGEKRYREQAN